MSNIRQKNKQSSHNKAYYQRFRTDYNSYRIRRRGQREKMLAFFEINPAAGSPSQVRTRPIHARRKARKAKKK